VLRCAGAHPTDVRMTTRFKEHDLTEGLTGAIHETGHALYEQGRNLDYDGLPVNQVPTCHSLCLPCAPRCALYAAGPAM
jgi:Zn-dependent M32 family carboxypeptidase